MKAFATFILTFVPLLLLRAPRCYAAKTQLALSAGNTYMNFRFDVAQRCYSLDSCYAGKGSYASWLALKDSTRIAFYTKSQCQGDHVTVNASPRGTLKFAEAGFGKKVYSFVLWEIDTYPMSGFLDICHGRENAVLNVTNSTRGELAVDGSDWTLNASSLLGDSEDVGGKYMYNMIVGGST